MFDKLDSDNNGLISCEDIHKLITEVYDQVTLIEIDRVVKKFDSDSRGQLNCTDFIKLVSEGSKEVTTNKFMTEIFEGFDKDGDGLINKTDLQCVMRAMGEEVNQDELNAVFDMFDISEDGNIDFQEFLSIVKKYDEFENTFLFKQD